MHKLVRAAAFAVGLVSSAVASAGAGVWTTNGPHGGEVPFVAQSRSVATTVYAAGRGGVFRSTNAGDSWLRAEVGLPPNNFTTGLGAGDGNVVYVTSNARVFRSNDAALTWTATSLVPPAGAFSGGLSVHSTSRVAVAMGTGVYVTSDGGTTWKGPGTGGAGLPASTTYGPVWTGATTAYAAIAFEEATPLGGVFVYKTTDGGTTWVPTTSLSSLSFFGVNLIRAVPGAENLVFAFDMAGHAAQSPNSGGSWNGLTLPAGCGSVSGFEPRTGTNWWISCDNGVFETTSAGFVWSPRSAGLAVNGTGEPSALTHFVFDFTGASTRLWAGSTFGGVFRSDNLGVNWLEKSNGLESTNVRALAAHPVNSGIVFAGYGDSFTPSPTIYRTTDGALTWPRSNASLEAEQIRALAIDPTTASGPLANVVVYAVGRSEPFPAIADKDGGIYKSINGGFSWSTIDNGIPARSFGGTPRPDMGTVRSVVLDPKSCAPAVFPCATALQTVYVGGSGRPDGVGLPYLAARIYKSTNAGGLWTRSDNGMPPRADIDPGAGVSFAQSIVVPLIIDPTNSQTLYAGTTISFDTSAGLQPTLENGVWKSDNGGANWSHSSEGLPRYGDATSSHWDVLALGIAPNGTTLYAGTGRASMLGSGSIEGAVFKSTDGGENWTFASTGVAGSDVRALFVDPSDASGNTVYAATAGMNGSNPGGVYKTSDGGLSWDSITIGLPADAATALARDPSNPNRIYAGTVAGVWELTQVPDADLDGVPDGTEQSGPGGASADTDGDNVVDSQDTDTAVLQASGTAGTSAIGSAKGTVANWAVIVSKPQLGNVGCAQVNNAQAINAASLPAIPVTGVSASIWGQLRFELQSCTKAFVDVTFPGANFSNIGWAWFNYGPRVPGKDATLGWYVFDSARKLDADTWRLSLDANLIGNYRSDADTILFQGGPVFVTGEALLSNSFE